MGQVVVEITRRNDMEIINSICVLWNKGKLVGQKAPFKLKEIWAIRVRLPMSRAGAIQFGGGK
jgi:hypothetical protein